MIAIAYHADLDEVQGGTELARLLDTPLQNSPFDRLAWWRGLASDCAMRPLLAVAHDEESGARAVLPLARSGEGLAALTNWYSFSVRPIVTPGADPLPLLTALARDLARHSPRIVLAPLPQEGGEASLLADVFRGAGWFVDMRRCDTNHILPVNGRSFAEYLAARPGPLRTTLKRKARKVDVAIHRSFDPAAWSAYEAVYRASWKPSEGSPEFLRHFAETEGAAGRLRLGIAYSGGTPVAVQFWTVEGATAFIHKLAHTEASKPLSPGTTLSAALFEEVIDRDRVSLVDFGTGNDAYKQDWMEAERPRFRLEIYRPAHPGNWPPIARAMARRLAGGIRQG